MSYHNQAYSNNIVQSYPPPSGPPAYHLAQPQQYTQQQYHEQQQYSSKNNSDDNDEKEHILTGIMRMRIFRILIRFIDQGSPLLIYSLMKLWASNLIALIISMVPPILRLAYFLIVYKKIDPCGILYLLAFVIAAFLTLIPTDLKNTMIRDSSIVVIMGGMFIISLLPIRIRWFHNRPLIYLNSKKTFEKPEYVRWKEPSTGENHKMELYEWAYAYYPTFKKACIGFTALYGILFVLVFVSRVLLVNSSLSRDEITNDILIISLCVNIGVGIVILFCVKVLLNKGQIISEEWKIQNGFV